MVHDSGVAHIKIRKKALERSQDARVSTLTLEALARQSHKPNAALTCMIVTGAIRTSWLLRISVRALCNSCCTAMDGGSTLVFALHSNIGRTPIGLPMRMAYNTASIQTYLVLEA